MLRLLTALLIALSLVLAACGDDDDDGDSGASTATQAETTEETTEETAGCKDVPLPEPKPDGGQKKPTEKLAADKKYEVTFETSCGSFSFVLDQKTSPNTAASFAALVENGLLRRTRPSTASSRAS